MRGWLSDLTTESFWISCFMVQNQTWAYEQEGHTRVKFQNKRESISNIWSQSPRKVLKEISTHNCSWLGSAKSWPPVLSLKLGTVVRLMRIASMALSLFSRFLFFNCFFNCFFNSCLLEFLLHRWFCSHPFPILLSNIAEIASWKLT